MLAKLISMLAKETLVVKWVHLVNSLAPGKFEWNFRHVIFKQILVIDGWGISCEIALIWMSLDFTDDQSTLVQVMAWCRQATSHYLSQCWPKSMSPYGVTRPQWVKFPPLRPSQATSHYLSQCWPRSMSPYGVTRPQWVKFPPLRPSLFGSLPSIIWD